MAFAATPVLEIPLQLRTAVGGLAYLMRVEVIG